MFQVETGYQASKFPVITGHTNLPPVENAEYHPAAFGAVAAQELSHSISIPPQQVQEG